MKKKIMSTLLLVVFLVGGLSAVVSCKDYDDDINANVASIDALRTELNTVKSNLETQLTDAKSSISDNATKIASLETALAEAKSATTQNATKIASLEEALKEAQNSLSGNTAKITALETQLAAANDAISKLQSNVEESAATLAALTGEVNDLTDEVAAAKKNIEIQKEALEALEKALAAKGTELSEKDAELQKQIDELKKLCENFETSGNIEELRKSMNSLSDSISKVSSDIDVLTVLVNRALASISLVPDLYVDGIEAIEFKSLEYTPKKFQNGSLVSAGSNVRIDNGLAEATYRLNPSTVNEDCYDEAGMEFVAAIAETRAVSATSPVAFNGIKSFKSGLMTVYLKKTTTDNLELGANKTWIVAFKVPRNAKKYEAADIYSENSRLVESTHTPQIAAIDPETGVMPAHTTIDASDPNSALYHYSDSLALYNTRVDATPLEKVAKKIFYKDKFNLNDIVTGCYVDSHNQITKATLKSYGLTFRYAIAKAAYTKDADNQTDQQQFATVTPEGIISSKTPAGVTDNEAVVGKEPIVRVTLVDTVHNKVVDQRYLKVKWTLTNKEAVKLADKASEATLSCKGVSAEYTWAEFVNEVYAKANELNGMSQSKFEAIYPFANISSTQEGWTTNWPANYRSLTSAPGSSAESNTAWSVPVFSNTTNANGDALIAKWALSADEIETVYCSTSGDTKTFKVKVTFKSAVPSEYPDLYFYWTFTIKLPSLPEITGYYDQYWKQGEIGQTLYVLPVQWNTQAYFDNVNNGINYCVYNNNLMNAFTYDQSTKFIVKNLDYTCGSWDMQFSYEQSINPYKPNYTKSTWSAGKGVDPSSDPYKTFGAYQLMKNSTKALQMNWDEEHISWCATPTHYQAYVFGDHSAANNGSVEALLNPLGQKDVTGSDGTVTPEYTDSKKVSMTVWGRLNGYNHIPVLTYNMALVAPLRINSQEIIGTVQDGVASGDQVKWTDKFTLTDFRGYLVASVADGTYSGEQNKYTKTLWNYYEIESVTFDASAVKYTFKNENSSVKVDNNLTYAESMTAATLRNLTNGNIDLSLTQNGDYLVFKNNGGSNIEAECYAYVPVTVKYGFGELTATLKVKVVPHGHK